MSKSLQLTLILAFVAVIALSAVAFFLGKETVTTMAVIAVTVFLAIAWATNA